MRRKTVKIQFRTSLEEQRVLVAAACARGYSNPSAFARAAVRKELSNRDELTQAEQRVAASFDRLMAEVTRLSRQQQALFALVDTFAKTFLTCVSEPPVETRSQAAALASDRYGSGSIRDGLSKGDRYRRYGCSRYRPHTGFRSRIDR